MTSLVKHSAAELRPRTELDDLRDLLYGWLAAKKESTQLTYKADLADFARWWDGKDVDRAILDLFRLPQPAANAVVLKYREDMITRKCWSTVAKRSLGHPPDREGLAPSTINRRLSALRSVAKIAKIAGAFNGEILITGIRSKAYRNTVGVGAEGYQAIVDHLEEQVAELSKIECEGYEWARLARALRDRAIIRLLHDAGLRRAEVVRLRMADVFEDREMIRLTPKGPRGDTEDWELGKKVWHAVTTWVQWRGREAGALFHAVHRNSRKALDMSTVNRIVQLRGGEVGLDVRPHDLRHTAITTALDKTNGDVRRVSRFSRHRDVRTVMVYDDHRKQDAKEIQDMISEDE